MAFKLEKKQACDIAGVNANDTGDKHWIITLNFILMRVMTVCNTNNNEQPTQYIAIADNLGSQCTAQHYYNY